MRLNAAVFSAAALAGCAAMPVAYNALPLVLGHAQSVTAHPTPAPAPVPAMQDVVYRPHVAAKPVAVETPSQDAGLPEASGIDETKAHPVDLDEAWRTKQAAEAKVRDDEVLAEAARKQAARDQEIEKDAEEYDAREAAQKRRDQELRRRGIAGAMTATDVARLYVSSTDEQREKWQGSHVVVSGRLERVMFLPWSDTSTVRLLAGKYIVFASIPGDARFAMWAKPGTTLKIDGICCDSGAGSVGLLKAAVGK